MKARSHDFHLTETVLVTWKNVFAIGQCHMRIDMDALDDLWYRNTAEKLSINILYTSNSASIQPRKELSNVNVKNEKKNEATGGFNRWLLACRANSYGETLYIIYRSRCMWLRVAKGFISLSGFIPGRTNGYLVEAVNDQRGWRLNM